MIKDTALQDLVFIPNSGIDQPEALDRSQSLPPLGPRRARRHPPCYTTVMDNFPPRQPPAAINLERRVKHQAWAPAHELFAVTAPGLELLCAAELTALSFGGVEPLAGGVAFAERLDGLYAANLWLRTAGRVLLRLKDFRVHTWEDLLRQAAAVPWEVWLWAGTPLKVLVKLHKSNLKHTERIAEEVLSAAAARLASLGLKPPMAALPEAADPPMVMVRGYERRASLSLDSSGQHLHRRGYRLDPGQAPLREDLAAALLMLCGYNGQEPLLDPMCGSGTLAIEAGLLARRLPPRLERSFAFQEWPSYRAASWQFLQKQASQQAMAAPLQPIYARDLQPKALTSTKANAKRAGLEDSLILEQTDFFSALAPPGPGLLVINPPYGKRLGSVRLSREFSQNLGQKLKADYAGWRVGVVLYRPEWEELVALKPLARLVVPHGGLTVTMLHGMVKGK
ncbi:RNA methyltransferase [Desulfarculales bacterium]